MTNWATTPSVFFDPAGFAYGPSAVKLIASSQPLLNQTSGHWVDPQTSQSLPFDVPYRGAWLMWADSANLDQQYGYFEIRCKVPGPPEMYTAFWLIGRHIEPEEIDIFEFNVKGVPEAFTTTIHWGPDRPHKRQKVKTHQACRPWEQYHIYACQWTPTEVRWYYDNKPIRVTKRKSIVSEFSYPLALVIDTLPDTRGGHHPENGVYPG